jgi:hypothetical protein
VVSGHCADSAIGPPSVSARVTVRLLALAATATGCASVSPERGDDQVAALVAQAHRPQDALGKGPPDAEAITRWVRMLTAAGLTSDRGNARWENRSDGSRFLLRRDRDRYEDDTTTAGRAGDAGRRRNRRSLVSRGAC